MNNRQIGVSTLRSSVAAVTFVGFAISAGAETPPDATERVVPATAEISPGDTVATAIPGPQYDVGDIHAAFLGRGYRDLWTTPITVDVLDVHREGGGLTPTGTGGGFQTTQLRFTGADGLKYTFRSIDKDPSDVVPEDLQTPFVRRIVRDQTSAAHPTASPVVAKLLDHIDILHNRPRLVVLPDDAALGEYRHDFAGRLGTFITYPDGGSDGAPGFAGATEVIGTVELVEMLLTDPRQRIDVRSYLRARLLDVMIGDWDRHKGQWRWANIGEGTPPAWVPIPEDRDQAFARYDAPILAVAGTLAPMLTEYDETFPDVDAATHNGHDVDSVLLTGAEWSTWEHELTALRTSLTDAAIDEAVRQMPPEHYELSGARIAHILRTRRDDLSEFARAFYLTLADQVTVHLTDATERVTIHGDEAGVLTVIATAPTEPPSEVFNRRFLPDETREVRLFLHDGHDSVSVVHAERSSISLRIVSEVGSDVVTASPETDRVRVYGEDSRAFVRSVDMDGTRRDWGSSGGIGGSAAYMDDLGALLSANYSTETFGFRHVPFKWTGRASVEYATATRTVAGRVLYRRTRESSPSHVEIDLSGSGHHTVHYYGMGNDAAGSESAAALRLPTERYRLATTFRQGVIDRVGVQVGLAVEHRESDVGENRSVTGTAYGMGSFTQFGLESGFTVDRRDRARDTRAGWRFNLAGSFAPAILDVEQDGFGSGQAAIMGFVTPVYPVTLAARVGAEQVWGAYPLHQASFLGGPNSMRSLPRERFAGDAAVHASAQVRVRLVKSRVLIPAHIGVLAAGDMGRVYLDGESPDGWHTGVGGGIWFAPIDPSNIILFSLYDGEEGTRAYLELGYGF